MQKIDFLGEDGNEVIFKKKEKDDIDKRSKIADTNYFEVNLAKGTDMCIKLKSDDSEIIFHNPSLKLINNVNEGVVKNVKPLEEGDVVGVVCSFFNGEDGNVHSLCQFLRNGDAIGIAMRMKGNTVTPMIFNHPSTTTVHSSLVFGKSKIKEGNCSVK